MSPPHHPFDTFLPRTAQVCNEWNIDILFFSYLFSSAQLLQMRQVSPLFICVVFVWEILWIKDFCQTCFPSLCIYHSEGNNYSKLPYSSHLAIFLSLSCIPVQQIHTIGWKLNRLPKTALLALGVFWKFLFPKGSVELWFGLEGDKSRVVSAGAMDTW